VKVLIIGILNSNCSKGQMKTYEVTRRPHYDVDATIAVPECTRNSFYILFPAKGILSYWQIISSRLYVCLKRTFSLAGRELLNTGE